MTQKEKIRTKGNGITAKLFPDRKIGETERWIYGFLLLFVALFFLLAVVSYYFTWSEDQAALREGLSWSAVDNVANHAGKLGATGSEPSPSASPSCCSSSRSASCVSAPCS